MQYYAMIFDLYLTFSYMEIQVYKIICIKIKECKDNKLEQNKYILGA